MARTILLKFDGWRNWARKWQSLSKIWPKNEIILSKIGPGNKLRNLTGSAPRKLNKSDLYREKAPGSAPV